jgi:hypothetical protein
MKLLYLRGSLIIKVSQCKLVSQVTEIPLWRKASCTDRTGSCQSHKVKHQKAVDFISLSALSPFWNRTESLETQVCALNFSPWQSQYITLNADMAGLCTSDNLVSEHWCLALLHDSNLLIIPSLSWKSQLLVLFQLLPVSIQICSFPSHFLLTQINYLSSPLQQTVERHLYSWLPSSTSPSNPTQLYLDYKLILLLKYFFTD